MVVSGTIREFILADVSNLLAQQKLTGRFILIDGKREGGIVFKDGIIVGGDCGEENLPNKLFNFLTGIKRVSPDQLSPVFNAHAGNLSVLAATLLERNLLSARELKSFSESCVEDICCGLLAWDRGTYRFNPQHSIASLACGVVTIPIENIIMEGMRRTDEWIRMQEYIKDDMVFVPARKGEDPVTDFNLSSAPEEYVLSLLDGSSTVESIKKSGCLCEYKVFESINILLQTQRITALHQKYTQPIQAALKRKDAEDASVLNRTFFGSLFSVGAAAAFVLFFLFCRMFLLPGLGGGAKEEKAATDAVRAAEQLYRAVSGEAADDPQTLKKAGLLTGRDL